MGPTPAVIAALPLIAAHAHLCSAVRELMLASGKSKATADAWLTKHLALIRSLSASDDPMTDVGANLANAVEGIVRGPPR